MLKSLLLWFGNVTTVHISRTATTGSWPLLRRFTTPPWTKHFGRRRFASWRKITHSQAATFWVLDSTDQPRLPILTSLNFDPRFLEEYQNGMVPLDPTVLYLVRHPEKPVVHDGLVITEREKDRHPYYDWHGGWSDTRFRMVGQVHPAPGVQAGVAMHRTQKAGRYEPGDIEQFAVLHRHLERALAIGFRLASLGALQRSTTELLDRNPAAILLLDEHRRIIYANANAEAFQSGHDGIRLSADGISATNRQDNEKLQGLISQALSVVASPAAKPGGVMRGHRPSGKPPWAIVVSAVARRHPMLSLSTLRPAVCIMITDPDGSKPLPRQQLQAVFGLTEAEARLAALLAGREELRAAAAQLSVTYGTARTRLAGIFQKTNTRRQGVDQASGSGLTGLIHSDPRSDLSFDSCAPDGRNVTFTQEKPYGMRPGSPFARVLLLPLLTLSFLSLAESQTNTTVAGNSTWGGRLQRVT